MNFKLVLAATFASVLFFSCHHNVVTGKKSMTLIPEGDLVVMSEAEYTKFLNEHPPLPANHPDVKLVRSCGEKIQKAVETYYAQKNASDQLKDFKWEFNVVDENVINAWCMPGGKVVFYTGILPVTENEEGLAVVMGHEVAHAVARHGNQRMSQGMMVQFGGAVLSTAMSQNAEGTQYLFSQAYGITTGLGALSFSRKHETEADKMGLIFAAMAGYNPEAAIGFWQRMAKAGGQGPPQFLSTHPSSETRIRDLQGFMPEAKKYYKPY
ncbi:MAG: M48 family metallopeptidase [Bacteroidia bacterium]|jgi:predicted Zn-dependent protease|nr:M48 family metallopeptidase [Bacteroidia bacterium]